MKNDLRQSLALAFERTATEPYNIDNMIVDVTTESPNLSENDFTKAIINGSLGKYEKVYKLSTTEVCFWIREFLEDERFLLKVKTTLGI